MKGVSRYAPEGTPRRRVLQLISLILIMEGFSVIVLFSYWGFWLGVVSISLGIIVLAAVRETTEKAAVENEPWGLRAFDWIVRVLGGEYSIMALGTGIILLVLAYNRFVSTRPDIGDIDTISILFGGVLLAYPLFVPKFRVEACFSVIFLAFLVTLLVIPQALFALAESERDSQITNWYVHYMLAAPFASILDVLGIAASSSGNIVTMQFQDGSQASLAISAYCAGLYSFSIFVSAFIAFVLVFERLPKKTLLIVLVIGLLIAYLGNLFRMVIIGVIGYYQGLDALLWAHRNVGWIVFFSWSAVFWFLLLTYVSKRNTHGGSEVD